MNQLSFPTVQIPGLGPCVSKKILVSRGGISGNEVYKFQSHLHSGADYACTAIGGGNAQNYYSLSTVLKMAEAMPTEELQSIAQEIRSTLYPTPPAQAPQSLPAYESPEGLVHIEGQGYTHQRDYVGDTTPLWRESFGNPHPSQLANDPRVAQLAQAVSQNLPIHPPAHSPTPMSQQELFNGIQQLQNNAVSHVQQGFDMALSAQDRTADTIRRARPNVTNNSDNRIANAYEYADHAVHGMGRVQFGLLISAILCVSLMGGLALLNIQSTEHNQYAPSSSLIRGH